jgi:hypothetical protein
MYINKSNFVTEIYPFADTEAESYFTSCIRVSRQDGRVWWNGQDWTPEDAALYLEQLRAGFDKAFELAKGKG